MEYVGYDPGYGFTKVVIGNFLQQEKFVFPSTIAVGDYLEPSRLLDVSFENPFSKNDFVDNFVFTISNSTEKIKFKIDPQNGRLRFHDERGGRLLLLPLIAVLGFYNQFIRQSNNYSVAISVVPRTVEQVSASIAQFFQSFSQNREFTLKMESYSAPFETTFKIENIIVVEQAIAPLFNIIVKQSGGQLLVDLIPDAVGVLDIGTNTVSTAIVKNEKIEMINSFRRSAVYQVVQRIKDLLNTLSLDASESEIIDRIIRKDYVFSRIYSDIAQMREEKFDLTEDIKKIIDGVFDNTINPILTDFTRTLMSYTSSPKIIVVGGGANLFKEQFQQKVKIDIIVDNDPQFANAHGALKAVYLRHRI